MSDTVSLSKIISKDFDLPDNLSAEQLREVMINAFTYLIEDDFQKLVQILYRADVDQDQLKVMLEGSVGKSSAEVIADAYISRQMAKVETWKKYSSKV
ncbi:MAG: hypothetical protein EOP00_27655 [Pedobacter sp.]|nr:MAG: hypothetical protein EOP00_27655 [Pedobacter sp.]